MRGWRDDLVERVEAWALTARHLATALAALAIAGLAATVGAQPRRPNIVILFADDLGYGDVSAWGGDIPTPRIDALAAAGVRFTDGYVTAPVCNPSRAGLLSGRYQQRWGQELNSQTEPPQGAPRMSLPTAQINLAQALQRAGYRTGAIGKWQQGMAPGYHPLDRGFDYFFGMASGTEYVDPSWPKIHVAGVVDEETPSARSSAGLFRGREPAKLEEYLTDQLAREGVDFIERNKAEPFFLYLAFYAPHAPLQVTDEYYQRFPAIEPEGKRIYTAMVSALDDGIGRVIDKLEAEQLLESTLVVFISDNGAASYVDFDGKRNHPLTGHKRNLYEGGIRIPFAMRWTGRLPAGTTYRQPVSSLDLFPTVLAAAGIEGAPGESLDGVNLLPFLEGSASGAPHQILFWRSAHNAAARQGDWKLITSGDSLVRLYDLAKDVGENEDLSRRHPDVVAEMLAKLERWKAQLDAPRRSQRTATTRHGGDAIEWHI